MAKILVVDDEVSIREFLEIMLRRDGHQAHLVGDAVEAIQAIKERDLDLVITDLSLPRGSGMDVLSHVNQNCPDIQVIMITAFATAENAITAMKLGAYDYIIKPFKIDELKVVIERALERRRLKTENIELKAALQAKNNSHGLIGSSPAIKEVFGLIQRVAPTKTTVLLTGESGTGKEMVARAIHTQSPRSNEPFVAVNCGAIPETLIESELFGHMKGSFTGAHADKPGLFERASAGTVFLDEIGELPLSMQVKLLRVLQEKKVRRIGGAHDLNVECRVVAATNRSLEKEVADGRFREDLYFRLNVIEIKLPPLRERKADIPLLARAFLGKFAEQQASPVNRFSDAAMLALMGWHWPGNVRELSNVVERGVTLAGHDAIDMDVLPPAMRGITPVKPVVAAPVLAAATADVIPVEGLDLEMQLEVYERRLLEAALARTNGKKKKAADLLKLSLRSFRYRLAKFGIGGDDDSEE